VAWRIRPDDSLEIRVTDGGSGAGPQVRVAGPEAIDQHWPGTPEGLAALKRLLAVPVL
jgi:hypothetical protein